jgi:hypothetical protein
MTRATLEEIDEEEWHHISGPTSFLLARLSIDAAL